MTLVFGKLTDREWLTDPANHFTKQLPWELGWQWWFVDNDDDHDHKHKFEYLLVHHQREFLEQFERGPLSPNGLLYLTICPPLPNSLCCSSMVAALNRSSLVLLFVLSIRMSQVWQSWQYSDSKYRREQNLPTQSATVYLVKYVNWTALY